MTTAAEVGIMPDKFWHLTERELMAAINGYRRRQVEEWKRARLMAYMTYATQVKDPAKIEHWMPLEGDHVVKTSNTLAQIRKLNKIAEKSWR